MDFIKRLVKKYLTKNNIRKIFIFVIPLLLQFLHYNNFSIPFVLIGAYTPIIFNAKTKTARYYFMFGVNLILRFVALIIGLIFIFVGRNYGMYNIIIGSIFLVFAIIAGIKMPYSITGMILINLLAYFFLNDSYSQFAVGFLIFILVEFMFGELELLAPFSKKKFSIDYKTLGLKKSITVSALTTLLILTTIGIVSVIEPFGESYAREQIKHERKIERQEKLNKENEEFLKKIRYTCQKLKEQFVITALLVYPASIS